MKYILDESYFRELLESRFIHIALENGGVDNWEWYGDSIEDFVRDCFDRDDVDPDEGMEQIIEETLNEFKVKGLAIYD